jgi:lysophospholipase L1-like esterase
MPEGPASRHCLHYPMKKKSTPLPQNIICFGDSISEQHNASFRDAWPSRLQAKLNAVSPEKFNVFNRGRGGNTTAIALERIEADVKPWLPGLVLVEFGVNDANVRGFRKTSRVGLSEFAANLREIHRYVVLHGGECIFMAIQLPESDCTTAQRYVQGNGKSFRTNYSSYRSAMRRIARNLGIECIDISSLLAKKRMKAKNIVNADGIHLNASGNIFYAEAVFSHLRSRLPKSD